MTTAMKFALLFVGFSFLSNTPICEAATLKPNTICYYSFDMERIVPFNEPSIHTAECYAITDDEFESVNKFLKNSPTAEDSTKYQSTSLKAMIYNDSTKMYVDENGIVKIDGLIYKNAGAKSMRNLIQSIIKNKPKLPQKR